VLVGDATRMPALNTSKGGGILNIEQGIMNFEVRTTTANKQNLN